MKRALFITIGTRDVLVAQETLISLFEPKKVKKLYGKNGQVLSRPAGEFILENINVLQDHITLPIITPLLSTLRESALFFDNIYLVATNQTAEKAGEFYQKDTIFFAKIIGKILQKNYKIGKAAGSAKITVVEIKDNVTYLDNMFHHFQTRFKSNEFILLKDCDEIHVLNQGGIDAINYSLLLNLLYLYSRKVKLYNVNERTGLCLPLEFGQQFGYEQEKILITQAVKRFDYSAFKNTSISSNLAALISYAEARLNFDFESAYQHLTKLNSEARSIQEQELLDIRKVQGDVPNLTAELYWNSIIRYEQEAYVDFIQRFFRIIEQYAQSKALSSMKHFDFNPEKHKEWKDKLLVYLEKSDNLDLKNHLDAYLIQGSTKLDYTNPSIPVFQAILKFYHEKEFDFINTILPLSQLRNKGIGAHGFSPISLHHILTKLGTDKKGLDKILKEVGKKLKVDTNPFERINASILKLLN